jgi:hypothetical protein
MRVMIRFSFPADLGNEIVSSGKINQIFKSLLDDLKPEAAYFFPESGQRGGLFVVNMADSSDVAKMLEPIWLGIKADVTVTPVMNGEDLQKGLGGIGEIVKRYA